MAHYTAELPETYASITRPVALEIMRQLMDNLKIKQDVPIFFPGANGKMTTWNANNIEETDAAQFTAREKIVMNIRETYTEEDLLTLVPKQTQHPPVFLDKDSNIKIAPIYSRTKVVVSLTYRTRDRWQAESFRDHWRRKIGENREYLTFKVKYQYPIPELIEKVLFLLYHTRKKNLKDFETYQDYLFHFGSVYLTSLTNAAGKGDTLAMSEIQENIFGNFTDPNPPEIEKDEIGAVWTSNVEFEYYYDKPISINIKYPIMINNELIPSALYPEPLFNINELSMIKSMTNSLYGQIQNDMGYQWHMRGAVLRIPEFDDWSTFIKRKYQTKLISVLLTVDDNPKEIFNLTDMGEYGLHSALQSLFKLYHLWLTKLDEFPFYVQLYENDDHLGDEAITIDSDLNIIATHDLSRFKLQHIVISVINNISDLSKEGKERFFSHPQLVNVWLDIMLGYKPIEGYPKLTSAGRVDVDDFERICKLHGLGYKQNEYILNPGGAMATVGVFGIATHALKEYKHGYR